MPRLRPSTPVFALLAVTPAIALAGHVVHNGGIEPRVEFDFDDPTPARHHVTDRLALGASAELEVTAEVNFDLDDDDEENEVETRPSANLSVAYEVTPDISFFGELELSRSFIDGDDNDTDTELEVKQAKLTWHDPVPGLTLTLGRMEVSDEREWLFDDELDGIDLVWRSDAFAVEAGLWREELVPQSVFDGHKDGEPDRAYLRAYTPIGEDSRVDAWALGSFGRKDDSGDTLVHLGVSSAGEIGDFDYWFESAVVLGEENDRDVQGWGFDIGAVRRFKDLPLQPHVAAGLAFGSGDDGEGTDTAFRQTGLQDNTAKFGGVTSYRSYGELVDPELSNLIVPQVSVGIRPTERSSIDLAWRKLLQHKASDELRDSAIDADPNGRSRNLGDELDLVIGIREFDTIDIEAIGGVFLPGGAFDDDDPAYFVETTIRIEF